MHTSAHTPYTHERPLYLELDYTLLITYILAQARLQSTRSQSAANITHTIRPDTRTASVSTIHTAHPYKGYHEIYQNDTCTPYNEAPAKTKHTNVASLVNVRALKGKPFLFITCNTYPVSMIYWALCLIRLIL